MVRPDDLGDEGVLRAKGRGARFAIEHRRPLDPRLAYPRHGAGTAQRGSLTPDDVIDTWPTRRLRQFLREDRAA